MKPAFSNRARWFSQLGSLIQTCASGFEAFEEVGADLQAAGAAQRLDRDDAAALGRLGAEHQLHHRTVVALQAVDWQIAVRRSRFDPLALGAPDALEQRHLAAVVAVNADAQVDLVGFVSATKASVTPRMGSRGAICAAARIDLLMDGSSE